MKYSLIAFGLTVGFLFTPLTASVMELPTDISQQQKPATIKVLIGRHKDRVLLEAKGRYLVYNPFNQLELDKGSRSKRAILTSTLDGINWNGIFPGIFQIRIVPADAESTLLIDGIEYKGCVEVYAMGGKLNVVNEVDIERYLKATLTSQFTADVDKEVIESVAVIARTHAYFLVSQKLEAYWHVEAQEVGYQGHVMTMQNIPVEKAINTTRHLVLTYNHQPFATAWTKDSAGRTADFPAIFRKAIAAPHGVNAPFAARDREKHGWTLNLSKQELAQALGVDKVNGVDLFQDKKSDRVYAVRVKNGRGTEDIDFFQFQKLLGEKRLKSNDFTVHSSGDQIVFKGYGEGHGVGLCLYSATVMAENGEKASKILTAFFPETTIENIRSFRE